MYLLSITALVIAFLISRSNMLAPDDFEIDDFEVPAICVALNQSIEEAIGSLGEHRNVLEHLVWQAESNLVVRDFKEHVFPNAPVDLGDADASQYWCPECPPAARSTLVSIEPNVQEVIDGLLELGALRRPRPSQERAKPLPRQRYSMEAQPPESGV